MLFSPQLFSWNRRVRHEFCRSIVDLQLHFIQLLQRPDNKQELVDSFIAEYNSLATEISDSMHLDAVKVRRAANVAQSLQGTMKKSTSGLGRGQAVLVD